MISLPRASKQSQLLPGPSAIDAKENIDKLLIVFSVQVALKLSCVLEKFIALLLMEHGRGVLI